MVGPFLGKMNNRPKKQTAINAQNTQGGTWIEFDARIIEMILFMLNTRGG
jgi:hypothetical protein